MAAPRLSVRELSEADIPLITAYWLNSSPEYMLRLGVDVNKIPSTEEWHQMLLQQTRQSYGEKTSYCLIWEEDGTAIGHSNVNKIIFGKEAYMHLHMWQPGNRGKGLGLQFIRMCVPIFFDKLQLHCLYCEPHAHNEAPNKLLEKAGFRFIKEYLTTPGWINFEQPVRRWEFCR